MSDTPCVPKDNLKMKRTASFESVVDKVTKRQKINRADAPKIVAEYSESTSSKAACSYDSAPTCSSSEVQDLKSGLDSFAPAQIKDVTGYCNDDFDIDELIRVMDQDDECNNENKPDFSQIESVYVQQDPYWVFPDYFDFDSMEVGRSEEGSFSPEELGLTWDELVQ